MLRDYKKNLLIKFIFQQFMHYIENNFIIEIHEKILFLVSFHSNAYA